MDATLICKKELEKEGSDLTDKTMFTSGIYFECAKEQIFFLNPNIDLSPIDFLKFVRVGELVDKEAMASPKLKNPTYPKNALGEGEGMEGGESGDPYSESVIENELSQEEE